MKNNSSVIRFTPDPGRIGTPIEKGPELMSVFDFSLLLLLAALWGFSFLFIRIAVPALGPLALADIRVLLAGLVLVLYGLVTGRRVGFRGRMLRFLILGAINGAIPFSLINWAELHLTASMAAILNSATPLFGALIAGVWLGERITAARAVGLALGFVGVGVVVGWNPQPVTPLTLAAAGAMLLASFHYGLGSTYAARYLRGLPTLTLAAGQQLGAGLVLLPLALAFPPAGVPPRPALLSLLALALLCTAVAYLLYFRLLERVGPTSTLSVTYLVPIFGLIWGRLFLQEPIGPGLLVGLALVLLSVTLVTGFRLPGLQRIARSARP